MHLFYTPDIQSELYTLSEEESKHATGNRNVSVRFGIPGTDAFATDSGINWAATLKSVEEKIRRQLRKNKVNAAQKNS